MISYILLEYTIYCGIVLVLLTILAKAINPRKIFFGTYEDWRNFTFYTFFHENEEDYQIKLIEKRAKEERDYSLKIINNLIEKNGITR
jgi:hypothetical protein